MSRPILLLIIFSMFIAGCVEPRTPESVGGIETNPSSLPPAETLDLQGCRQLLVELPLPSAFGGAPKPMKVKYAGNGLVLMAQGLLLQCATGEWSNGQAKPNLMLGAVPVEPVPGSDVDGATEHWYVEFAATSDDRLLSAWSAAGAEVQKATVELSMRDLGPSRLAEATAKVVDGSGGGLSFETRCLAPLKDAATAHTVALYTMDQETATLHAHRLERRGSQECPQGQGSLVAGPPLGQLPPPRPHPVLARHLASLDVTVQFDMTGRSV